MSFAKLSTIAVLLMAVFTVSVLMFTSMRYGQKQAEARAAFNHRIDAKLASIEAKVKNVLDKRDYLK